MAHRRGAPWRQTTPAIGGPVGWGPRHTAPQNNKTLPHRDSSNWWLAGTLSLGDFVEGGAYLVHKDGGVRAIQTKGRFVLVTRPGQATNSWAK